MGENTSGPPTFAAYMVDEQQLLHDMSEVSKEETNCCQAHRRWD